MNDLFFAVKMKKQILFVFSILTIFNSNAQQGNWCGSDKIIQLQKENNPSFESELHQSLTHAAHGVVNSESKAAAITIPTVVHIIHDNGIGNISDAQIFSALEVMNIDYNRQNADTVDTRNSVNAPFKSVAGGMDIEFVLAKIDPQGDCTNGIVRVNAPHLTYDAGEECKYSANGGSSAWPKTSYFNIWVVNNIDSEGSVGIIAGYAYYPYGSGGGAGYGILIDDSYFGTIETAEYEDGRVLTHEMGHALGLPHIFNSEGGPDGCLTGDCFSEGDYSCDTPPQTEPYFNCNPNLNSCTGIPVNDVFGFDAYDQMENYMSYNSCQNMFSKGQVNIMEFNLVDISELQSLVSAPNLIATGVLDPDVLCKAEFDAYNRTICTGTIVDFVDFSFTDPTSWSWTISPGVEGVDYSFVSGTSASVQYPSIQFNTEGYYEISLLASDGVTSNTEVKSNFIQVLPFDVTIPFLEGFENYSSIASTNYWSVNNNNDINGGNPFEIYNGVGHTGVKSVHLINFGEPAGTFDEVISSPIDLANVDPLEGITLSFRYAYRKRNASNDEWLKVYLSGDCGDGWTQRKTIHGDNLSTLVATSSWEPNAITDWTTVHMTNVTSSFWEENFRVKFKFESDFGNNFYLDNINIYAGEPSDSLILGLNENSLAVHDFILFPNPTENELNVRFAINTNSVATVEVTDLTGKVTESFVINANEGVNLVSIRTADLSSGMYLLKLNVGNTQFVKQFVKR